jgi:hypothetical protein
VPTIFSLAHRRENQPRHAPAHALSAAE